MNLQALKDLIDEAVADECDDPVIINFAKSLVITHFDAKASSKAQLLSAADTISKVRDILDTIVEKFEDKLEDD